MDSILTSIKKMLGIDEEYLHFDNDIVMYINSVFSILSQLGVGTSDGFSIEDSSTTWDEFITDNVELNLIKSYMYLKVRLLFDPPQSSAVMECYKTQISEYESRLYVMADKGGT
jgi:hypothetical protein